MDAHTNVESLTFSFNSRTGAADPADLRIDHQAADPDPIRISRLLNPPLAVIPPIPKNIEVLEGIAKQSPIRAAADRPGGGQPVVQTPPRLPARWTSCVMAACSGPAAGRRAGGRGGPSTVRTM